MNRHSVRLLAAAFAVVGLAGCFSDPASSLRNGPVTLSLSRTSTAITDGDSLLVEAVVRDEAGNPLPATGATWTTDDATVATANLAATQAPSDGTSRAYIAAKNPNGGVTYVRINVRGLTDSIRVTSLPGYLPAGLASVTGTAYADTLLGTAYTAGDTVVINSGSTLLFDSAGTAVRFGTNNAYIISRSQTQFKVLSRGPYHGPVTVTNITFLGTATTGEIHFDSLITRDTVEVSHARYRGGITVTAGAFGNGTLLTLTATGNSKFNANATIALGASNAIILTRTDSTVITAISPANYTGNPKIVGARVNGVTIDSLYTPAPITIGAAFFPGTVAGTGVLSDIITVGAGSAAFTTTGANVSNILVNGVAAFVVSRSASTMVVVAKVGGTAAVTATNVVVGTTTIPQLSTSGTFAVATTGAGEAFEPANNNPGGAVVTIGTTAAPLIIYGSVDGHNGVGTDADDLWTYTTAATANVSLRAEFAGSGAGTAGNPDIDLLHCNATCSAFVGGFGGATASQPEQMTITNMAAGTYNIYINGWETAGATYTYKLTASAQ